MGEGDLSVHGAELAVLRHPDAPSEEGPFLSPPVTPGSSERAPGLAAFIACSDW